VRSRDNLRRFTLAALASLAMSAGAVGCGRCGSSSSTTGADAAPASASASAAPAAAPAGDPAGAALPVEDVPEIRDTGRGRATAALRAVLQAYGIAFDAATIERECKVDDEGASIDDLEDVAVKYGLSAGSVIAPAEHVLLPAARMLPAVVIVDTADDEEEFVVAWRLEGDRVQVMDPREGRKWVSRADLQKSLYVHEMKMPADEYQAALSAPAFGDALRARMAALGADAEAARSLLDRAAAVPGTRGLGALDASLRALEAGGAVDAGGAVNAGDRLSATFACALDKRCEGVDPIPPEMWSVQPAADGEVQVRGAVLLAIAGRSSAPAAPEAPTP
jgi:hypothetical protein